MRLLAVFGLGELTTGTCTVRSTLLEIEPFSTCLCDGGYAAENSLGFGPTGGKLGHFLLYSLGLFLFCDEKYHGMRKALM